MDHVRNLQKQIRSGEFDIFKFYQRGSESKFFVENHILQSLRGNIIQAFHLSFNMKALFSGCVRVPTGGGTSLLFRESVESARWLMIRLILKIFFVCFLPWSGEEEREIQRCKGEREGDCRGKTEKVSYINISFRKEKNLSNHLCKKRILWNQLQKKWSLLSERNLSSGFPV